VFVVGLHDFAICWGSRRGGCVFLFRAYMSGIYRVDIKFVVYIGGASMGGCLVVVLCGIFGKKHTGFDADR